MSTLADVEILAAADDDVLTREGLELVARLHRELNPRRRELLERRRERQFELDAGALPGFLPETKDVRADAEWRVAEAPADLRDRRCEITGPVDRKMMINALNSGARVFMADYEDACSPKWENVVEGQRNVTDAVRREISLETPDKSYRLNEEIATLLIRPRGWHLPERHALVDGEPVSASLFDFGLHMARNAREQLERGSGPYFYLPKLESHLEARLWADAFALAEEELDLPSGTIRCTVLIETILAAFEMEEILYELRDWGCALNAGRWDYIFSAIKKFRARDWVLPDRVQVTMTVPFMRAYTELLVQLCHKRGAHAIGGMAAFIPSRKDPEANAIALAKVREDKERESGDWLRRLVGRAPRSRSRLHRGLRRRARRAAEPARTPARGRRARRGRAPVHSGHARRDHRRRRADERLGRRPLPRLLAARRRRGGDRQPDGGRGDRRDLPLPDLAVGAPRSRRREHRP